MRKTILWLFVVALISRAIIALIQISYGISSQANLDLYLYGPTNPGFELYHDFYYYYVAQLIELSKGLLPYRDFGYSYTPLFLYVLYPFFAVGGKYLASVPILLADAATVPLIYLIVRRLANTKISFLAALSYALSPFFLLYEGYLWYSSQPMTFFLLLAVYFLFTKKPIYSSAIFAVAVLFKQEVIFVLPVYLMWYIKDSKKGVGKVLIVFCSITLMVSLPFLVTYPGGYISAISYGTIGHSYVPPINPAAATSTNLSSTVPLTSDSLICSTLSSTLKGLICNYGNFTYTDVKSIPPLSVIFTADFINSIALWIAIPLIAIVSYYAFLLRKLDTTFLLSGAISLMIFIAVFDLEIHSIYRYYLIPVYALILSSSNNRSSLAISVIAPIISLFLPSGPVQMDPPLICMAALSMMQFKNSIDSRTDKVSTDSNSIQDCGNP
jgi:hypothetical protein